jgi:hypothetical protein
VKAIVRMEPHNDFGEQEDVACKIIRTGAVGMPSNLIVYSWKQRLAVPWRCTRMASHKSATEWDIDPTNTSPLVRCRLHSCVVDCFRKPYSKQMTRACRACMQSSGIASLLGSRSTASVAAFHLLRLSDAVTWKIRLSTT